MSSGCYYYPAGAYLYNTLPVYLPQVELDVHATILSTSSRTVITQTFVNPSSTTHIGELFYTFPLYESSSVAAFTSTIDGKTVKGVVKPRAKAEEVYKKAKAQGKTAALFDQSIDAADVFKIRIGNLRADEKVHIELTLVTELKQDTQMNGPRYTFPLSIAPRYGTTSHDTSLQILSSKTSLKVDISMEKGSDIREIRSPSHPIAVTLGRTSSMAETAFESRYASVMLRKNALTSGDFILTINATNQDRPCALLETHPTLPDQRALMVSLVPRFTIPSQDPEIIFVIDRSGSMEEKIPTLQSALELFLKSIPIGVYFNIVSFGTRISYLWKRSKACSRTSLEQAIKLSKRIEADHGGTEILAALKAAVDSRQKNKLLDVLLLTDGQVWNQEECINFVRESHKALSTRFFTLGIGDEVSHSLIEGISRAGAGFSQTVLDYEELDRRVIYMLKGALMGRLSNITLDMNLPDMMEEEFTEIEGSRSSTATPRQPAPISLFNEECTGSEPIEELHPLPKIVIPDFIQTPNEIPALHPFVRTTAYVLLSNHIDTFPEKITLRGSSASGPLELEIPVQDLGVGETIHKLAAKKTTAEFEEGCGWIYTAKDTNGDLISVKCPARVDELVQNECERLGVLFQVAGKHCSIVAVHDNDEEYTDDEEHTEDEEYIEDEAYIEDEEYIEDEAESVGVTLPNVHDTAPRRSRSAAVRHRTPYSHSFHLRGENKGWGAVGTACESVEFLGCLTEVDDSSMGESRYMDDRNQPVLSRCPRLTDIPQSDSQLLSFQQMPHRTGGGKKKMRMEKTDSADTAIRYSASIPEPSKMQKIIRLQEFEGYWKWTEDILQKIGLDAKRTQRDLEKQYKSLTGDSSPIWKRNKLTNILATILVGNYFEKELGESRDVWELVKEKADIWVQNTTKATKEDEQVLLKQLIDGVLARAWA